MSWNLARFVFNLQNDPMCVFVHTNSIIIGFFFKFIVTGPPSAPYNVSYTLNDTSVLISWMPPVITGNRDDLHYRYA